MTAQRSFKHLVRARMAKTGESYTAARAHLLAGPDDGSGRDEVPRLACSEARIRERTGRGWEEWFELLDSWEAATLPHRDVTRRLAELQGLDPLAWNVQAVATSFERARGTRGVGQRSGGDGWVATVSRTLPVSADAAFMAFADPSQRAGWLPDVDLRERTAHSPVSARFDVEDGRTRLVVTVEGKGPRRSTVAVEHTRLDGPEERDAQKAFWRRALDALQSALAEGRFEAGERA